MSGDAPADAALADWLTAECFHALVDDSHATMRLPAVRKAELIAAIIDNRTLHSTLESGQRTDYEGGTRKKGSKAHMAVDTLRHLLALHVTLDNAKIAARCGS